jgi:hypothetical protein
MQIQYHSLCVGNKESQSDKDRYVCPNFQPGKSFRIPQILLIEPNLMEDVRNSRNETESVQLFHLSKKIFCLPVQIGNTTDDRTESSNSGLESDLSLDEDLLSVHANESAKGGNQKNNQTETPKQEQQVYLSMRICK